MWPLSLNMINVEFLNFAAFSLPVCQLHVRQNYMTGSRGGGAVATGSGCTLNGEEPSNES